MPNLWKRAVCVDASFLIQLMTHGQYVAKAAALWRIWHTDGTVVLAPTLILYEINNVLYQQVKAGYLRSEEATQVLEKAMALEIKLYGDAPLHHRALRMAQEFSLAAAYDAHYLALCERLDADFWTADKRLYNSVHEALPWVYLLQESEADCHLPEDAIPT